MGGDRDVLRADADGGNCGWWWTQMSIKKKQTKKSTYLADGECDRADECVGVRMHWRADADVLACRCIGVRMRWRADALVSRRG